MVVSKPTIVQFKHYNEIDRDEKYVTIRVPIEDYETTVNMNDDATMMIEVVKNLK